MDMDMDMDMNKSQAAPAPAVGDAPANYFRHGHQGGWMLAHISLMILSWVFVLPIALMLSVARSRYHLPAQIVFHIFNGLGIFTGFVYNHSTPDLYENNSHHPIGWVVTAFTIVWTLASLVVALGEFKSKRAAAGSHPMSAGNMAQHNRYQPYVDSPVGRHSRDSGHGTERNSASLFGSRQNSSDWIQHQKPEAPEDLHDRDVGEQESHGLLGNDRVDRFISRNVSRFASPRASKLLRGFQIVVEKLLLLLGFLAIATGFVVYGGVFHDRQVFSGAAHFIKGGIFFWYGLLTLGRWMGAFAEFGWAWNVRPQAPLVARWKTRVPSAEFTESFVIWLYGASNVFMEHLNAWGKPWTHQDFEHVSITVLFFGGGLLGMLIESKWVREALNTSVEVQKSGAREAGEVEAAAAATHASGARATADDQHDGAALLWRQPATSTTSLNPMPALVIMLLGMMMSGHKQSSMVSTMMHAQWGVLFSGFALARAATYVVMFIKPPTSHFAARPPSELVASFCLTAGGLMFMMSARDTVTAIEGNGLDAMTIFTVTMGLAGVLMAWTIVVFCVKGWAVKRERAAAGQPARGGI